MCYNGTTEGQEEAVQRTNSATELKGSGGSIPSLPFKKNQDFFKKTLDKSALLCYNKRAMRETMVHPIDIKIGDYQK